MTKKIIVAVHGIGDQVRCATIQSVAQQFCKYCGVPGSMPLGRFNAELIAAGDPTKTPMGAFLVTNPPDPALPNGLGFAEVYWADIPRGPAADRYTLEEAKKWTQTVVERVRAINQDSLPDNRQPESTFDLASLVLGEMIETTRVLENLLFLADKAGLLKFDLNKLLVDYLGDVQVFVDYRTLHDQIMSVFQRMMTEVHNKFPGAEIYLVAHSEGTVIAFLGLLTALQQRGNKAAAAGAAWVQQVRGFMTIGCPINKHLLLWPELWTSLAKPPAGVRLEAPIPWRNYYDYGDPVGFRLDATRTWLAHHHWDTFFEFSGEEHDIGFTRYVFPGKAHNDYWQDEGVFGHFIQNVVAPREKNWQKKPQEYDPPRTRWGAQLISPTLPFVLAAAFIFLAVYLLYRAIGQARPADFEDEGTAEILRNVTAIGLVLCGVTAAARIPRLTRHLGWRLIGYSLLLATAFVFPLLATYDGLQRIGLSVALFGDTNIVRFFFELAKWPAQFLIQVRGEASEDPEVLAVFQCIVIILGLGGVLLLLVSLISFWFPRWGVRPLIAFGCTMVFLIVLIRLMSGPVDEAIQVRSALESRDLTKAEKDKKAIELVSQYTAAKVQNPQTDFKQFLQNKNVINPAPVEKDARPSVPAGVKEEVEAEKGPLWPVFVAGAAFLYLWWLAALFFDLVVVWHHYIRRSAILDRLKELRSPSVC